MGLVNYDSFDEIYALNDRLRDELARAGAFASELAREVHRAGLKRTRAAWLFGLLIGAASGAIATALVFAMPS